MNSTRYGNGNLPRELEQDILLRLPVKVLARCKCVSKNWCSLIESKDFVKCHFESSQERPLVRLAETQVDEEEEEDEFPIDFDVHEEPHDEDDDEGAWYNVADQEYSYALFGDMTFSEYEEPIHLQIPDEAADVLGPLNGVFCVAAMHDSDSGLHMALLNPALRQFKPLPRMGFAKPTTSWYNNEYGFGLDPTTGDFKLVSLLYHFYENMTVDEFSNCVVSVCTSDSDSWRVLEDVDSIPLNCPVSRSLCDTYLKGVYYWHLDGYHSTDSAILAFDMRTDQFRQIQVRGCDAQSKQGYLTLCGDTLALLMYDRYEPRRFIDVWKMEDDGCWIRSSRVGPLEGIRKPVCFWKNKELLLETMDLLLAVCNVSTQEVKTFEVKRKYIDHFLRWVFAYKESLVSIKGESGCMLWDTSSDLVKNFFKMIQ